MKTKQILLTSLFLLLVLFSKAQDKYDFMTINYMTTYNLVVISINGKELLEEKLEVPKSKFAFLNTNPLLAKVIEYQDKGWDVMEFDTNANAMTSYIAYLKKKK